MSRILSMIGINLSTCFSNVLVCIPSGFRSVPLPFLLLSSLNQWFLNNILHLYSLFNHPYQALGNHFDNIYQKFLSSSCWWALWPVDILCTCQCCSSYVHKNNAIVFFPFSFLNITAHTTCIFLLFVNFTNCLRQYWNSLHNF